MSTEYGLGASQSRVDQEYVSTVDAFSQMIRSIYEPNIMETAFKKFPLIKILIKMPLNTLCSSRKYPCFPHRRDWNFLGGGGFCKDQKFKEMYEASLEFQRGGGLRKNPFHSGGMDIFWNY